MDADLLVERLNDDLLDAICYHLCQTEVEDGDMRGALLFQMEKRRRSVEYQSKS